jgi:hypothetical protein
MDAPPTCGDYNNFHPARQEDSDETAHSFLDKPSFLDIMKVTADDDDPS